MGTIALQEVRRLKSVILSSSVWLINTRLTKEGLKGETGVELGLGRGGKMGGCQEEQRQWEKQKYMSRGFCP